jgi:hypothetical protein
MDYTKHTLKELKAALNEKSIEDPGEKTTKADLIKLLEVRIITY